MLGYLRDAAPGRIEPVSDGWYDTGDIVAIDQDGYLRIQGRAKRFAKIAGEMVSLAAIEAFASSFSLSHKHAAIARPDSRKGEQIILATEDPHLQRAQYAEAASAAGIAEIMFPRDSSISKSCRSFRREKWTMQRSSSAFAPTTRTLPLPDASLNHLAGCLAPAK